MHAALNTLIEGYDGGCVPKAYWDMERDLNF